MKLVTVNMKVEYQRVSNIVFELFSIVSTTVHIWRVPRDVHDGH